VVVFYSSAKYPSASELRSGLEKGSDDHRWQPPSTPYVFYLLNGMLIGQLANINDANHPIRHAFTEQAIEAAASLLLGSVSEVW
jgi:hypothetical protein